jgi:tight adherence protein B
VVRDALAGVAVLDLAVLAQVLAAVLRAGLPPARAWAACAERAGPCRELTGVVARMVAAGGTAVDGLRLAVEGPPGATSARGAARRARAPVAVQVRRLAVCLDVAERTGAPLADVLDGYAAGVRADAAALAEVEVALEAPKATANVLSLLPAAALGLGALLGADPVAALLGTGPGRVCLLAGLALWGLGRWWIQRMVAAAVGAR